MAKNTTKVNNILTVQLLLNGVDYTDDLFIESCEKMWLNAVGILNLKMFSDIKKNLMDKFDFSFMHFYAIKAQQEIAIAEAQNAKSRLNVDTSTFEGSDKISEEAYADEQCSKDYKPSDNQRYARYWAYRDKAAVGHVLNAFFGGNITRPQLAQVAKALGVKQQKARNAEGLTPDDMAELDRQVKQAADNLVVYKNMTAEEAFAQRGEIREQRKKWMLENIALFKNEAARILWLAYDFEDADAEAEEAYERETEFWGSAPDKTVGDRVWDLFYGYKKEKNGVEKEIPGAFEKIMNAVALCKRRVDKQREVSAKFEALSAVKNVQIEEAAELIEAFERDHSGSLTSTRVQKELSKLAKMFEQA